MNNNNNYEELEKEIKSILSNNPVVLFMKGEKDIPACGFSAGVVHILNTLEINFESINILSNQNLRSFMKEFSDWPTFPQLYYQGNLIGGYDIIEEMYNNGELKKLFNK